MKEYCVDLEIAKELKKNGFPQKSNYSYVLDYDNEWYFGCNKESINLIHKEYLSLVDHFDDYNKQHIEELYSAPTSDEILKELPLTIENEGKYHFLTIFRDFYTPKEPKQFYCIAYNDQDNRCLNAPDNLDIEDDKLSNALAKMYLYLKKEGYIKWKTKKDLR